ncbi:prophage endopeptidase tail family protein [Staphylococcus auricularis]|uniref:Prophage endopeptidase tail family protein n=1 Tax=Staphylococcus auricularis TaxID=29379 RepID=A0AAW7MCB8_9STAP|nr:prophage endopeptidase tail family protein [Staphylococcus auricularis]MDC6328281.1 prophage endopeptidase tail family protein [Staphylococcus auricularis]MDN4532919.1 prophage endopeptidase tail family protein [Staphylococcus auricularis]
MENLVLVDRNNDFAEIINDFDFGSFKYEYEINGGRSISFVAYKTSNNADIFNGLLNENYILWKGQKYVIKSTELKYENAVITNEVVAEHISMEFQNHFVDKDLEDEEMDDESSGSESDEAVTMKLNTFLKDIFKNNKIGFDYEVHGEFKDPMTIESVGDKNGIEALQEGAESFGYIYFGDNKTIHIYKPDTFYEPSDEILVYKYNTSTVSAKTTTTELRTIIKGYGKKKKKSETKNYNPIKPPSLSYSGKFIKEGTWRTEEVGASYSKTFNCKWGNENLTWSLKKMSKGGIVEVYLDGKSKGQYSCYSKNASTKKIVIAKGLKKGKHTFKVIFRGKKDGVDYKNSKPNMYVGTRKSNVLNLTAVLKGKDIYHTYAKYKSDNYDIFGHAEAPTIYDDNIKSKSKLIDKLKESLNDEPTLEVSTNYLGLETLHENNTIRFIHKPLGFNADLKVVKLIEKHPLVNQPIEVEFSNAKTDILKIQQQLNKKIKNFNKSIKKSTNNTEQIDIQSSFEKFSEDVGSVIIDE